MTGVDYIKMDYKQIAKEARIKVLELIYKAQVSHIGSNFSCTEILVALFDKINFDQDKFIAAKSWAAATVYYLLWHHARITEEELESFCQPGSKFIGLVEPGKDLPFGIGSMGYGLPAACGFAWSKKQKKEGGRVFVLESDGGMQEGSNWEAIFFAAHHKLSNLVMFIDRNGFCAMGKTNEIVNQKPLARLLKEIGWQVFVIDGHNFSELETVLRNCKTSNKPVCVIADTVKGKGVSWMENSNLWHYAQVKDDDYQKALKELNAGN